jgi:hypothetical protein
VDVVIHASLIVTETTQKHERFLENKCPRIYIPYKWQRCHRGHKTLPMPDSFLKQKIFCAYMLPSFQNPLVRVGYQRGKTYKRKPLHTGAYIDMLWK